MGELNLSKKEILTLKDKSLKLMLEDATLTKDVNGVVLDHQTILARIKAMAKEFRDHYIKGLKEGLYERDPFFMITANGALPFSMVFLKELSDLNIPYEFIVIQVSSYIGNKSGQLNINTAPKDFHAGRRVYILEDMVDTGNTVLGLKAKLLASEQPGLTPSEKERLKPYDAASVDTISLIDKMIPRAAETNPFLYGFRILPQFVIGFGLDFLNCFRGLLKILTVKESTIPSKELITLFESLDKPNPIWSLGTGGSSTFYNQQNSRRSQLSMNSTSESSPRPHL